MTSFELSEAAEHGRKFAELFYEKLDKSRIQMGGLYHPEGHLIWNGHSIKGKNNIVAFYEKLPITSSQLLSVDAQGLGLEFTSNQPTITVICGGRIQLGSTKRLFSESFLLTAENNVWKIVSDTYRDYN